MKLLEKIIVGMYNKVDLVKNFLFWTKLQILGQKAKASQTNLYQIKRFCTTQ